MAEEVSAALREADRVRAAEGARGWYEVFYVTVAAAAGRAAWLRYTLLAPRTGTATASLWGCAFDRARPRWFAARSTVPATAWRPRLEGGVELPGGGLEPHGCRGEVQDADGRRMRWELAWTPLCAPFSYFPAGLERIAPSATFPISAVPLARARGSVEVDGERIDCEAALVEQAHLFGGRHAHRWGWLHALGFDADPEGMLTLIWARPQRFGGRVPAVSAMALRLHGRLLHSGGIRAVRWDGGGGAEVRFSGRAGAAAVEGRVSIPADLLTGVTYHDPDGAAVHCANTEVADLELRVRVDGVEQRLRCTAACGVERGARSPQPGIWRPL